MDVHEVGGDVRGSGTVGLVDRVDMVAAVVGLLVEAAGVEGCGPCAVLDPVEQDLEGGDLFGCGEAAVVGALDEQLAQEALPVGLPYRAGEDLFVFAACGAIEGLWRGLAMELGPHGVRANVIRSAGSPDASGVQAAIGLHAADAPPKQIAREFGSDTPLRRAALLAEVADVAAMLASDRAGAITAALVNVTCGAYIDV